MLRKPLIILNKETYPAKQLFDEAYVQDAFKVLFRKPLVNLNQAQNVVAKQINSNLMRKEKLAKKIINGKVDGDDALIQEFNDEGRKSIARAYLAIFQWKIGVKKTHGLFQRVLEPSRMLEHVYDDLHDHMKVTGNDNLV